MDSKSFYESLPFALQQGETIEEQIKPIWKGYLLKNIPFNIFISLFLTVLFSIFAIPIIGVTSSVIFLAIVIAIIIFLLSMIGTYLSYNKYKIWITDQRIISANGVIAYSTRSIPLETITDVILGRSISDRILGLSSLTIVPMGGIYYGNYRGSNGYIPSISPDDAMKIQKNILDLRNARKKSVKM